MNARPTIVIKQKEVERLRVARTKLTKTIRRQNRINFQIIQTKTTWKPPMRKKKVRKYLGMLQNFDLRNKIRKINFTYDYVQLSFGIEGK